MKTTFKIDGLRELEQALAELPKAVGKAVLRRTLIKVGQPMADAAAGAATRASGALADSAGVSSKLSKRQAALHRKMFQDDRAAVEMFVGFGALPQAHLEEFGGPNNDPQPMLRPAWDSGKMPALEGIKDELAMQIERSAARAARKAARLAAKG